MATTTGVPCANHSFTFVYLIGAAMDFRQLPIAFAPFNCALLSVPLPQHFPMPSYS